MTTTLNAVAVSVAENANGQDVATSRLEQFLAAIELNFAEKQETKRESRIRNEAKKLLAAKLASLGSRLLEVLKSATYLVESTKGEAMLVLDAKKLFVALWKDEFSTLLDDESDIPEEWQFAKIIVEVQKNILVAQFKLSPDRKASAWEALCERNMIGAKIERRPPTLTEGETALGKLLASWI